MAYANSSLMLDSQLMDMEDPYQMPNEDELDLPGGMAGEEEVVELRDSKLVAHLNPSLGAAAALLPQLRWLCACAGIATAAVTSKDALSLQQAAHNTPGDANSAVTAVANVEQVVADNTNNMAALLFVLFQGEFTTTAATTPSTSLTSLTQSTPPSSSASASSSGSGTAVSVPGIISITRQLTSTNRLDPVRSALLALLLQTCQKHAYYLKPHLSSLIHLCLFVVRAEKLGRLKEKAMELLGFLLMLVHTYKLDITSQSDYTPPRDIIQQLFNEINVSKSKLSQTMRGNLLATLGLMSELHEQEFRRQPDYARNLADMYGRSLIEELESTKDPNRRVIEGCLIGLKHFLMFFSELYRTNHQQKVLRLENIYKAIRISLNMQDTRYDILRAGLACFSRHAALFKEFITCQGPVPGMAPPSSASNANPPPTETEALLGIFLAGSKHPNVSVHSRSNFALEAFLQQVTAYLIEPQIKPSPDVPSSAAPAAASGSASSYPPHKRKLFNLLLSVFVKKLDSSGKSVAEVSLAVRALGQLARVIVVYLNAIELRKILNKLLENSEKLFRSQTTDEIDRAVGHFPDFLASFAFIIRCLPECDMSILDYLVTMLRRFFLAYPTFTSTQRSKNVVSLTRLFVVLYEKGIIFQHLLEKTIFNGLTLTISQLPELTSMQYFMTGKQTDRHAYIEYCYLFHNLLGVAIRQDEKGDKSILNWNQGLDYLDESIVWRMRKVLFDQIMSDTLKLLKQLDLSLQNVSSTDEDDQSSSAASIAPAPVTASSLSTVGDASSTLQPTNYKDVELFLNLIEFIQRFFFPPYGGTPNPLKEQKMTLNHYVSCKSKLSELILPSHISNSSTAASSFLTKWFLGWISLFIPDLIELSNKYPLISGYYKLIALIGKIMEQYQYFDDVDTRPSVKIEEITDEDEHKSSRSSKKKIIVKKENEPVVKMEDVEEKEEKLATPKQVPLDTLANRRFVFDLMSGFLSSVLVRIGQFTDELLYSSIHLVLTVPLQFIELDQWIPALIKSIQIGKNYRPAAYLSIDVLNKWNDIRAGDSTIASNIRVSSQELVKHYPTILPQFYDYLRLPRSDALNVEEKKSTSKSKSTRPVTASTATLENMEFELVSRILEFLGKVGGNNRFILGNVDGEAAAATASTTVTWDSTHAIKYSLLLSQKLDVYLDQLLPQLTHLAEFSTERKIQVAACEALHSLIIYMIATTASDPNRTHAAAIGDKQMIEESSFLEIYKKLFPILLRLATSVEIVTKQLFHPLLFQIIHYFTNTNVTLYKDSRALLEAVADAVGNDTNGALREYAAEALAEFFKWSMKHGSSSSSSATDASKRRAGATAANEEEKEAPPTSAGAALNTKSLLRRLYSLALHPSPYRRLGAALTFNKLYKVFREFDGLISTHTLDLLDHMLDSLRLAQLDDDALGTKDEIRSAIEALERIVTDKDAKKHTLLLKQADRAGPLHCKSLPQFLTHLIESAGSTEDDFRRESLRLFQSFCTVLPVKQYGGDRGQKYFDHYISEEQSLSHFVEMVERGVADDTPKGSDASAAASSGSSDATKRNEIVPPSWILEHKDSMNDVDSNDVSASSRWQSLQVWLTRLSSSLDVYWWLLKEQLMGSNMDQAAQRIFGPDSGSQLKDALKHFLLLMQTSTGTNRVEQFVTDYAQSQASDTAAQKLTDTYTNLKCTVLIRFFRLMQLLLSSPQPTASPSTTSLHGSLLGKAFYTLVFNCLLLPESMGFQISNIKRTKILQATIGGLCTSLNKITTKHSIIEVLSNILKKPEIAPASFQVSSLLHRVGFSHMVMEGYRQLWSSGLLALALGSTECTDFAHQLLFNAFELHTNIVGHEIDRKVTLTPLGKKVANQMLNLAFHIGVSPDKLFGYLTDQTPVELPTAPKSGTTAAASAAASSSPRVKLENMDIDDATTAVENDTVSTIPLSSDSRKGQVFYTNFRSLIDSYLTVRFSTFSTHILSRAFTSKDMFSLLLNVADYVIQRRQRKKAVQHAFQPTTVTPMEIDTPDATSTTASSTTTSSSSNSYSSILSQVQAEAESYVTYIINGFADACQTFMSQRTGIVAAGSSVSGAPVPFNKKLGAKQRRPAVTDTTKLLQLPTDNELASMLLHLLEKLIVLDSGRVLSPDANTSFTPMLDIYCQCLSTDAILPIKKQALTLLPAFFLAPTVGGSSSLSAASSSPNILVSPPGMDPLVKALQVMLINPPFPQQSIDLTIGSPDYIDYTSLLDLLLNAVVLSKNFALLELLLPILREGNNHIYKNQINMFLSNYLNSLVDTSIGERATQVDQVLNQCWTMIVSRDIDSNPKNNVRYWLGQFILIPLLRICSITSVKKFFEAHLKSIFTIMTDLPDGPKITADLAEQELQLQELEIAYSLLALMFKRLPDKADRPKSCDHKEIIKFSHNHVKKCVSRQPEKLSFQNFSAAAYNALASALMATQTDPKFLNVLCFTENLAKGEELWSHIIDVKKIGMLRFEIETNFNTVEAQLADLQLLSRPPNSVGGGGTVEGEVGQAVNSRYLSSQYLSDSSVSQDSAGLFENQLSGPIQAMQQQKEEEDEQKGESKESDQMDITIDDASGNPAEGGTIELLDLDPILTIPAVPILLNLIQHMDEKFGAAHRDMQLQSEDLSRMPQWMTDVYAKFSSPSTHVTIKWCIAKLVVLKRQIFKPYASQWFIPIVSLLTLPADVNGGVGFHYFLRDLCSVFLSWKFVPGPDEPDREAASALISHLMRVAVDHGQQTEGKRSRLRANLLTIKLLIDLWRDRITIDRRIIHAHLTSDITKARIGSAPLTARQIGLQLLAIILEKGFLAYEPIEDKDKLGPNSMLDALIETMMSDKKTLYEPAAEVLGIWIQKQATGSMKDKDARELYQKCLHVARTSLKKLFFQREYAIFFNILLKLCLYLGRLDFVNDEILTFMFQIPQQEGDFLHMFLSVLERSNLHGQAKEQHALYERLKSTIRRVFQTVDAQAHYLLLNILFRIVGDLSLDELRDLLPDLCVLFPKHPSERCRMMFYKILIWIFDNHEAFQPNKKRFIAQSQESKPRSSPSPAAASSSASASTASLADGDPLVRLVLVGLLKGLNDPVAAVRDHLFMFWDDPQRLPASVEDRLLKLLTTLFQPETVDLWLSYATRLLMYPMRKSSDWARPFSGEALANCKFVPMNIDSSGYTRSQPFAPLFGGSNSQSLSMQMTESNSSGAQDADGDFIMEGGGGGFVLNSQAMGGNFQATPSLMSMNTQQLMDYNLSQASQSEHLYFKSNGGASQVAPMGSYQAFTGDPRQRALKKRLKGKKHRVNIKTAHRVNVGGESVTLRFAGSSFGARSNSNKWRQNADLRNRYRRVWEERLAEESAAQVTMYRKYRKGELPDIEIAHKELLQPLESLHTEPSIAKQLFVTIFLAVYTKIPGWTNPDNVNRFRTDLRKAVLNVIHSLDAHSSASAASLVCALQTAILECGREDASFTANWSGADIKQLGDISYDSKNYHIGVLLLEHVIGTKSEVKLKTNKRIRDDELSERHDQAYLQLARLYRELGENEIMMNLYSTFARQEFTRSAIGSMLRGDWQSAMSQYDDALTRFDMVQRHESEWTGGQPSTDEIELWSDERLECLRQLTDWSTLRENVLVEVDHMPDRLWDPQYRSKGDYLRHYLTSGLKCTEEYFLNISNAAAAGDSSASSSSAAAGVSDPRNELMQFVERALNDKDECQLLQNHHAPDLVLLYALRGSIDNASTFLKQTYLRFLQQWIDLPSIATGPRLALLQRLQQLTEVSEFLHIEQEVAAAPIANVAAPAKGAPIPINNPASTLLAITSHLQHQLSIWRHRLPSKTDSVESWDDIVMNRSAFLVHLKQSLEGRISAVTVQPYKKLLSHVVDDVRGDLSEAVTEMYRKAANVMTRQGNTTVADKYIAASKQLLQAHGIVKSASMSANDAAALAQYEFLHTYSGVKVKIAHLQLVSPTFGPSMSEKQIDDLQRKHRIKSTKTLYQLRQQIWEAELKLKDHAKLPSNAYRIATMKSQLHELLAEQLVLDPSLIKYTENKSADDLYAETVDDLTQLSTTFQDHIAGLRASGLKEDERQRTQHQACKAFMTMAKFCDERLNQAEDHRDGCDSCKSKLHCGHPLQLKPELETHLIEALVKNVMAALKLGSSEARGFFPRALELMGQTDVRSPARAQFTQDAESVPSWMFIQWIPQLLAVISLPQGPLAHPILIRIAKDYPQAIFFPFNLTRESFKSGQAESLKTNPVLTQQSDKFIRACGQLLRHRLLEQFTECLDYLAVPEMKLKDLMRAMQRAMLASKQKEAQKLWTEFRTRHFSSSGTHLSKFLGPVYVQFASDYKTLMDSYFGADGTKLLKMSSSGAEPNGWSLPFKMVLGKIEKSPGSSKDTGKKPVSLYTTWLGQYEKAAAATGEYIELPGQYTGQQKPQPELHIRIVNFDPMVLIMSSLRKPKRLTINGTDERSHHYLVKGGEDLRMDQRIEQAFTTMNEILAGNAATSRRQLSLRTYQVIPFTSVLGILEWVDNTEPLKGMLLNFPNSDKLMNGAAGKYASGLMEEFQQVPGKPPVNGAHFSVYYAYIKNVDKKKVTDRFLAIQSMFPSDLIPKAIARLCSTPESFLVFRSTFARSYSTFTMCAYILGIGDRHLENFLVDKLNSEIVGIDFGAAFGQGVLLSVPELMPFRYTRQFQNMLQPLRTEEILKQDMTYVMTALRQQRRKLLTVMDVFIKEPQLEWVAAGKNTKQSAELGDDVEGAAKQANDWYPRRKLRVAKYKLEGHNPAKILKLELQENKGVFQDTKLYEKCVAILRGDANSKRASLDLISSPEDQVSLLLEMAKDPNILGRTWTGWGPYL